MREASDLSITKESPGGTEIADVRNKFVPFMQENKETSG